MIAHALMERFPNAPRDKLGEAMVLAADISDRTAKREQLAGQRALAVRDFLAKNSYAHLEEACDLCGILVGWVSGVRIHCRFGSIKHLLAVILGHNGECPTRGTKANANMTRLPVDSPKKESQPERGLSCPYAIWIVSGD